MFFNSILILLEIAEGVTGIGKDGEVTTKSSMRKKATGMSIAASQ